MGTVVHAGIGTGVVVATGRAAEFGRIAARPGRAAARDRVPVGLRRFSVLLVWVAAVLTASIFVINVLLHRPLIDALLFSLAIAVGITPQLLPAVVSTSLAAGSRRLARRKVLVKRLVCIEDLGDIDVLFTDKTGTLTEGRISFSAPLDPTGGRAPERAAAGPAVHRDRPSTTAAAVGGNPLDAALWDSRPPPRARRLAGCTRLGLLPFDHERRMVLGRWSRAGRRPDAGHQGRAGDGPGPLRRRPPRPRRPRWTAEFAAGNRVVAVATRPAPGRDGADRRRRARTCSSPASWCSSTRPRLAPPRRCDRLAALGIAVKIVTGDNPLVAEKVCPTSACPPARPLTGADLDALDDDALAAAVADDDHLRPGQPRAEGPHRRALQRRSGGASPSSATASTTRSPCTPPTSASRVDSATDVAKDAADVILLEKDLGVLADGVVEGRRIFANTIKYVLMGTSSNFGNMFSAAGASAFLPLPADAALARSCSTTCSTTPAS